MNWHMTLLWMPTVATLLHTPVSHPAPDAARTPETVLVTYHAKSGFADSLERVLTEHWRMATELDLVDPAHHVLVRADRTGMVDFVEVFTWRSDEIPDNAPAPIRSLWTKMNRFVEPRAGQRGLSFIQVKVISAGERAR